MLPLAGQNLIMVGISMADTLMVGRLGDVQLSAAALANQFGFILQLLLFGTASGGNVLIAQFWGKGDVQSIHKVMTIMYRILAMAALVFTILATGLSRQILSIFTTSGDVIEEGAAFLRIVGLGYMLNCLGASSLMALRSVGTVKISLYVYLVSLCTNVFFNWVLIFGNIGAPALGVRGAAIATVISRVVEFSIIMIFLIKRENLIRYRLRMFFARKLGVLRNFTQNSVPVIINEFLWGMGNSAIAVIIGRMGTEFTAANSISFVLVQLVTVAIFGAGNASAVIIGNTVGAGEYQLAKARSKRLIVVSLCLGVFAMLLTLALKGPMLSLYSISDTAKIYANQMMTINAFLVLLISLAVVSLLGVLRGGGDTRFVALIDVLSLWLVAIPLGFLSGHVWRWPVPAVFIILKCDELVKVLVTLPRLLRGKWVRDLTIPD